MTVVLHSKNIIVLHVVLGRYFYKFGACCNDSATCFRARASSRARRPRCWKRSACRGRPRRAASAVSPEVALRCPAVSCAVRAISEATACLPLWVYRVGADGSREEATDHPVHALLTGSWNDWTSCFDGLYAGTVDALCNDRGALIWVNRIDGKWRELLRYKPGAWSVDRDLATDEPTFRSADRVLPPADCINIRAFGSTDRAPLSLAREAITLAVLMEQHAAKLFARGARPSGVLKLPGKITEAALARIRKSWQDTHGGSGIAAERRSSRKAPSGRRFRSTASTAVP